MNEQYGFRTLCWVAVIVLMALCSLGCLGARGGSSKIRLLEDPGHAEVECTYIGIHSSTSDPDSLAKDVEELIQERWGNEFLLSAMDSHFYVRSRDLWLEENSLAGFFSGLVSDLEALDFFTEVGSDSSPYLVEVDTEDRTNLIYTNGTLTVDEDGDSVLYWPPGTKEFEVRWLDPIPAESTTAYIAAVEARLMELGLPKLERRRKTGSTH